MAASRSRRTTAGKKKTSSGKKSPGKPAPRAASRRRGAGARAAAVRGKARAVADKVRAVGAGLAAGASAAVKALRTGPPPPAPERNGGLTEEERIESSKYLPRHAPERLFETERFVFPETYGVNRVRLLVKDPEWIFAHWDVDPDVFAAVKRDLGERAVALSRLTLLVSDPVEGGTTTILLPKGVRGWYVRAEGPPRAYRAELGLTLPTGEFRALASSNTVGTPRVGRARKAAGARVRFDRSGRHVGEAAAAAVPRGAGAGRMAGGRVVAERGAGAPASAGGASAEGGASDAFRPGGASDVFRR
jgi:hypothetical protein